MLEQNVYIPEQDPYSLNFQTAGYSTTLVLSNASSFLVNTLLHFSLVIVMLILYFIGAQSQRVSSLNNKLKNYLFWNGSIRLFMEAYLDFALFSMLNISEIQWPEGQVIVAISNYLSYVLLGLCGFIPTILCIFACAKRQQTNNNAFKDKYGAFLNGTRTDQSRYVNPAITIAMVYFMRRLMLSMTLVFWPEFLWGQISLQFLLSTFLIIIIQWIQPLESSFANRMETFNEVTTILILYTLMLFSDYIESSVTRSFVGLVYIGILVTFALVHLVPLFLDSFRKTHRCCKKVFIKCKIAKSKDRITEGRKKDQVIEPDSATKLT